MPMPGGHRRASIPTAEWLAFGKLVCADFKSPGPPTRKRAVPLLPVMAANSRPVSD